MNAANDNIQQAAWASLEESDIMPQIAEWPEIGDILSAAIAEAAAGGDVEQLMTDGRRTRRENPEAAPATTNPQGGWPRLAW